MLNPELNEAGIDYTYEVLPDGCGGLEIRRRDDCDEPGEGIAEPPEDWTIHDLEIVEGRSLPRPGEEGYVESTDVLSTAGNQAEQGRHEEEAESGDH